MNFENMLIFGKYKPNKMVVMFVVWVDSQLQNGIHIFSRNKIKKIDFNNDNILFGGHNLPSAPLGPNRVNWYPKTAPTSGVPVKNLSMDSNSLILEAIFNWSTKNERNH